MTEPLIVTQLPEAPPNGELPSEYVVLTWHDRRRVRQRVTGDLGTELVLTLPRSTILRDNQLLWHDGNRQIVVRARLETLISIVATDVVQSCKAAHQFGNWHRPIQILPDGTLRAEYDGPLHDWLTGAGIDHDIISAAFHPEIVVHHH